MNIRKANLNDSIEAYSVITACRENMKENGEEEWTEDYPNKANINSDIKKNMLYVAEDKKKIVACISINEHALKEFLEGEWQLDDENPLTVHRLAVLPSEQGKGIAKRIMEFVEKFAKEKGHKSIRLATYEKNKASNEFYQKIGYTKQGTMKFLTVNPGDYNRYEKILK